MKDLSLSIVTDHAYLPPSAGPLQELRLKLVRHADFRKTEETILNECMAEAESLRLGARDCILLISSTGKIIKFVFGFLEHEMINAAGRQVEGRKTRVLPSRTYRITDGGTFNPYMLQNYANEMGLTLAHLKKYEAHLRSEMAAKAA